MIAPLKRHAGATQSIEECWRVMVGLFIPAFDAACNG
jgi:hypothetical protein